MSREPGVRPADVVGAFSLATDLRLGQPMEHGLRAWLIASRLGDHLGVEPDPAAGQGAGTASAPPASRIRRGRTIGPHHRRNDPARAGLFGPGPVWKAVPWPSP